MSTLLNPVQVRSVAQRGDTLILALIAPQALAALDSVISAQAKDPSNKAS